MQQLAKLWRNGAFSIQHAQGLNFFYGDDHRWHKSDMRGNYIPDASGRSNATFPITRKAYLTFLSRSLNLFDRAEHSISSQILTYPKDYVVENPYKDFNRYLSNMRKNYDLRNYVAALELTKAGQWHYHLLVDLPYIKASRINKAWSMARGQEANNAVRDVRKVVAELAVMKYCADYMSKAKSKDHDLRKFTYSRGVMHEDFVYVDAKEINLSNTLSQKVHDYCTTGQLKSLKHAEKFFK